jgi:glycosyltransferase involved in cell wall biosynthesis
MSGIALSVGNYPNSEASANRHLAILRGLNERGNAIKLISLYPNKKISCNNKVYKNVAITYVTTIPYSLCGKYGKLWIRVFSTFKLFFLLIKYKRLFKAEFIIVFLTDIESILCCILFSKLFKVQIFHERTEYPFLNQESFIKKIILNFYLKFLIPRFDGLIVITEELLKYFEKYSQKRLKVISIVVEEDRFEKRNLNAKIQNKIFDKNCKYIATAGHLYGEKDGIKVLLKSFIFLREKYPEFKLLLIGENSNENKLKEVMEFIHSNNLGEDVIFTGKVNNEEIPLLLNSATVLCLARPNNIQARGGFPTKLAEYLMSGVPVLSTVFGEIQNYFEDGGNIFLCEPDAPELFAQKLIYIINNYENALEVSSRGRQFAINNFSYKIISEKYYHFLKNSLNA